MPVRDSKRALAEVAAMLGSDTATARGYLRRVQHLAGPVPYDQIAAAMRAVEGHDEEQVAQVVTAARSGDDRTSSTRPHAEGA
jgi:uncharacterized protein YbaA (DUF1428 family)